MNTEDLNALRIAAALAIDASDSRASPPNVDVEFYERIASTNDRARARVVLGQWDGRRPFYVAANYQSAGRGRRANAWSSPPGVSLLFTMAEPASAWKKAGALAGLAGALAVAEALDDLYRLRATIKWPNDVRIGRRKISGVLVERAAGPAGAALLFGMGVNVNQSRSDFAEPLRESATSVRRERGHRVDRLELLSRTVALIREHREAFESGGEREVLDAIGRRLDSIGRIVTVEHEGGRRTEGTAIGVEADGGLVVRQPNGHTVKCVSGSLIEH